MGPLTGCTGYFTISLVSLSNSKYPGLLLNAMLTLFSLQRSPHTLPSSTCPLSLMWRVKVELCDMPGHCLTNWTTELLLAGSWYMVGDMLSLADTLNLISWGFQIIGNGNGTGEMFKRKDSKRVLYETYDCPC